MAKPSADIPKLKNNKKFFIMLAFGPAAEEINRSSVSEFKRKQLTDISSIREADGWLEAARLAPSATNSQPWFFSGDKNEIIVSREKLSLIKLPIYDKMNQVDIGIVLYHLILALEHDGRTASFSFEEEEAPSGYKFMAKVK